MATSPGRWRPAIVPDIGAGREVLHAQPVNFALDHRTGLSDPRGQTGSRWRWTCIC
jgi:cell division ATPase FtsA